MTQGLRRAIEHKHELIHNYKITPTEENKCKSKQFNNKLTSLMRIREREYHEEQMNLNKIDLTKSWKIIKEIIGKDKCGDKTELKFIINGKITSDIQIICNEFNNYFVQIGPKLIGNFKNSVNPISYINVSIINSMFYRILQRTKYLLLYYHSKIVVLDGMEFRHPLPNKQCPHILNL